jgi:hypothetical protein
MRTLLFAAALLALVTPASSFTMPPPWVIMWGALAFAKTFTSLKDVVFLVGDVMFGSEGAACTLCDKARILEKLLFTVTLCSECTRALTFQIFCQDHHRDPLGRRGRLQNAQLQQSVLPSRPLHQGKNSGKPNLVNLYSQYTGH